jgi:succinate dehydrogenase flavin-adding protein (antitoxin of CptAB toxin-antitoxin module)
MIDPLPFLRGSESVLYQAAADEIESLRARLAEAERLLNGADLELTDWLSSFPDADPGASQQLVADMRKWLINADSAEACRHDWVTDGIGPTACCKCGVASTVNEVTK